MPGSKRWIKTLTVFSAAVLLANAAPLPETNAGSLSQSQSILAVPRQPLAASGSSSMTKGGGFLHSENSTARRIKAYDEGDDGDEGSPDDSEDDPDPPAADPEPVDDETPLPPPPEEESPPAPTPDPEPVAPSPPPPPPPPAEPVAPAPAPIPTPVTPPPPPPSPPTPPPQAPAPAPQPSRHLTCFFVSSHSVGTEHLTFLAGSPSSSSYLSAAAALTDGPPYDRDFADQSLGALRVTYPEGSFISDIDDPEHVSRISSYDPTVDLRRIPNATLEYSVFFPPDFVFVKGGRLPGLYGGHTECEAGSDASECFDTRMMWEENGGGELYLYAPRRKQTRKKCRGRWGSDCDLGYEPSIRRGSWSFQRGAWTQIRQDVWLNTPGNNDGGFNIWINGRLVLHADDVNFGDSAATCLAPTRRIGKPHRYSLFERNEESRDEELPQDTDDVAGRSSLAATDAINGDGYTDADIEMAESADKSMLSTIKRWFQRSLSKRNAYDDGHWKGINGYPGDPGYSPSTTAAPVCATATVTKTVTATVTVTAAPKKPPPAKKPPPKKPKPPAKKPAKPKRDLHPAITQPTAPSQRPSLAAQALRD
ncbi:hypothetical protein IAT40_003607 [Kwoniella sp. CBS 6097]